MAKAAAVLLVSALLVCLVSASLANQGTATYYTDYSTPSACYGYTDKGTMTAAANESLWNGGAACGTKYTITCIGGTNNTPKPCIAGAYVTVTIVDYCSSPGCQATFDLSEQAFAVIANLAAGKILIDYNRV